MSDSRDKIRDKEDDERERVTVRWLVGVTDTGIVRSTIHDPEDYAEDMADLRAKFCGERYAELSVSAVEARLVVPRLGDSLVWRELATERQPKTSAEDVAAMLEENR